MSNITRWDFELVSKKPLLNKPILIAGLPGIGNVGKIVIDFMIEELKAVKLYDISSYAMPNSVFVTEDNMVELPKIEMYHVKNDGGQDLLLLTGDVQPIDEESTYSFCDQLIEISKGYGLAYIITLGGIGLAELPKSSKVYCTGNDKELIAEFKKETKVNTHLYGVVGPIVGVSGLLLGLSQKKKLRAVSLLSETLGHPIYLGVKAARETLKVLCKKLNLTLDIKKLDKEIAFLDREMHKTEEISKLQKSKSKQPQKLNYIG